MLVLAGVVPTVGGTAEPVNRDQRAVEDRVHRSLRDEHRLGQARRQPGEQVDRLAHVAVHRATPAQGAGHAGPVAQVVEDPQDGVESRGGVPVLAEPVVDQREVAEGAGFAAAVANCAPDGEGSTVPVSGAGQLSAPPVDVPQAGQGLGLGLALAEPAGGLAGVAVDRGGVGVLTGLEAVAGQDGGQVDALPALAVVGLVPDRGHEVRPLRVQPGAGGDLVSRWRSDRGGDRAGLPFVGPAGARGLDCDACRDEVVVEQPGERPVPLDSTRWASASVSSIRTASSIPVPVSAARECRSTSMPGCRPSSRNVWAAAGGRISYDHENTARTAVCGSPSVSRMSSRRRSSASSSTRSANDLRGSAAARSPATHGATGSLAHRMARSRAARGSAPTRSGPTKPASSAIASSMGSTSRLSRRARSRATNPVIVLRLVTSTRQPGAAGNKGRTCCGSAALSSSTSIRRWWSNGRYSAPFVSTAAGIRAAVTPSAARKWSRMRSGSAGGPGP